MGEINYYEDDDDLLLGPLKGYRCVADVGQIIAPNLTLTRPCGKPTVAYDMTRVDGYMVIVALCRAHATELDGGEAAGDWPQVVKDDGGPKE